jgi:predicted RNA methylase
MSIEPLPAWLDRARLLAPYAIASEQPSGSGLRVELELPARAAAELSARLRGLGFDGKALEVAVSPPLSRHLVRAARLDDARARRLTTVGFTREGARATGEGRYSLTPEALALSLGELAAGRSVVDACCGSGGNTLGFARAGSRVTAIELARERLSEAQANARVYGASANIAFKHGDARTLVPGLSASILFVDPPWREDYDKRRTTLADLPLLAELLDLPLSGYEELWAKVPPSFEVASVPSAVPSAYFGESEGDRARVKFVLLRLTAPGQARKT